MQFMQYLIKQIVVKSFGGRNYKTGIEEMKKEPLGYKKKKKVKLLKLGGHFNNSTIPSLFDVIS